MDFGQLEFPVGVTFWSPVSQYLVGNFEYIGNVFDHDPYRGGGFVHNRLCPLADEIYWTEEFPFLDLDSSRFPQCDATDPHLFCAHLGLENPCYRARCPASGRFGV